MSEHSMRCVAETNNGPRCRRFGEIRVESGLCCRQHWTYGFRYFELPADIQVDPRIAARAAAVMEG